MLEDEKVILRPLHPKYYQTLFSWMTNPEVIGNFVQFRSGDFTTFVKYMDQAASGPQRATFFVIVKKGEETPVGWIVHFASHTIVEDVEIACVIIPQFRKSHYASRAAKLLVDYLFRTVSVDRIEATATDDNHVSKQILLRCGFQEEGKLRHYYFIDGLYRDVLTFSILREDWERSQVGKVEKNVRLPGAVRQG